MRRWAAAERQRAATAPLDEVGAADRGRIEGGTERDGVSQHKIALDSPDCQPWVWAGSRPALYRRWQLYGL